MKTCPAVRAYRNLIAHRKRVARRCYDKSPIKTNGISAHPCGKSLNEDRVSVEARKMFGAWLKNYGSW